MYLHFLVVRENIDLINQRIKDIKKRAELAGGLGDLVGLPVSHLIASCNCSYMCSFFVGR
jgi:hypothetical protein